MFTFLLRLNLRDFIEFFAKNPWFNAHLFKSLH